MTTTLLDKILNSQCICKKGLAWTKKKQAMIEPCEHIIHVECYYDCQINKSLLKNVCPHCEINIKKIVTFDEIKKQSGNGQKHYQKLIDMVSVANFNSKSSINKSLLMTNMMNLIGFLSTVPFMAGFDDGQNCCGEILRMFNAKLIVNGLEQINDKIPRVYIVNHTSYIDFVVISYLLKCGFLASSYLKETFFGRQTAHVIPLLLIDRGKSDNTVEKMKKYVKKHGSICLFPEGMITHPNTITRFRTGAFNIGYPIYPIVLRYEPLIYDDNINIFAQKILSNPKLTIFVDILPIQMPPFNSENIENIRNSMGKVGNMALSRVSNRDTKD